MIAITLFISVCISILIIYLLIKNRNLEKNIIQLKSEYRLMREQFSNIDQTISGKSYEGEEKKYGGIEGFGGTKGKVDYLEKKLDSLIDILNKKLIDIGKKTNSHEAQFGKSLSSEVISNMFEKEK